MSLAHAKTSPPAGPSFRRPWFVHTAGPDVALIKSNGRKDVRVVIGGRMMALPVIQRVDYLSLALRTITVRTTNGLTSNGLSVDVTSACQVKIQGWTTAADASTTNPYHHPEPVAAATPHSASEENNRRPRLDTDFPAVRLAAQHFLRKSDAEIEDSIQKTIAGHQRAIIGVLTVEELSRDRNAFCKRVLDLCSGDMRNMGITIVSYTVAEISDTNGYITALGVTQIETAKRDAQEGQARHRAAGRSRSAQEEAGAHLEVNRQAELKIASDMARRLKESDAEMEVQRRLAVQHKAHDISSAEQDKELLVMRQQARAAEAHAELEVLRQQVEKEKLKKMAAVNANADAELYKARIGADAILARAEVETARIKKVGEAEAQAIRAKGLAEVEVLRQRNLAWQESYVVGR